MILFLVLALLAVFAPGAHAQTSNPQIRFVTIAPSGACNARAIDELTPNGTLYTCQSGMWGAVGGGGGGGSPAAPAGCVQLYGTSTTFNCADGTNLATAGVPQASLDPLLRGYTGATSLLVTALGAGGFVTGFGSEAQGSNSIAVYGASLGSGAIGVEGDVYPDNDGEIIYGFQSFTSPHGKAGVTMYNLFNNSYAGGALNKYGVYTAQAFCQTGDTNCFAFYSVKLGPGTNKYYEWFDDTGVCVNHSISTFDSVSQARPSCYNPLFTQFTVGAVDFERWVIQWETNVAAIRTEKGGTGTLRNILIDGAEVDLGTSSHLVNIPATSFKFAGVTCQLTTVATITGVMRCM